MNRDILDMAQIHGMIREKIANYHADILHEVKTAIADNPIVVVGMAQNPFPKKACKILDSNGMEHIYLEYGSYFSQWRRRNALKMWSGWPTFPMIFVKGILVGGASELKQLVESGELAKLLFASPPKQG